MSPLLANDKLFCSHNGQVQLQSNMGKNLEVKGAAVITKSDLMSAPISGCSNNIAGVPQPCTSIPMVPDNVLSQSLSVGGEGVVLADMVSMIMTDKGVPLMLQGNPPKLVEVSK